MKEIKLNKGKVALVDDEDFEYLSQFTWRLTTDGRYPSRDSYNNGIRKHITMHREIMGFPKDMMVDHIDRNGLNNQRSNLRLATNSQNLVNSGAHKDARIHFRGVSATNKSYKRVDSHGIIRHYIYPDWYVAQISKMGVDYHLGTHKTPEEAARAYDKKAIELFGEFAYTNFPRSDYI